jgi:hypothetical protein
MKITTAILLCFLAYNNCAFSQNPQMPAKMPPGMTPEQIKQMMPPGLTPEQIKKMMPPGVQMPAEMMKAMGLSEQGDQEDKGEATGYTPETLVPMLPVQQYSYNPEPSPRTDYSPFGSGRNAAQRRAALIAVEAELNAMPLILPQPESTPTIKFMLGMASELNKNARQKFSPDDLADYSRIVTWIPRFDGEKSDPASAKRLSIAVAMATNNLPRPYFNMAVGCAVFALDPASSVATNNMASAILSAGEMICEKNPTPGALAVYRRDAEAGYLYAIWQSMVKNEWSEESLTPVINLGNLCIDLGKMEEARSLFMVARKIKPESWDAALGLAGYFIATGKKDKALAILEDEKLDKPMNTGIPVKASESLEKSEEFADLPVEAPESKFEQGINIMASEPVLTSADFVTQLDQSERNKMRYFIEHLPPMGSYAAPKINKLTQYASLKAICGPQGISALTDFQQMLAVFSLGSFAATSNQQLDWLASMGLKIDPGVDMNDVARNPAKYMDKNMDPNVKISGMEEFLSNMQNLGKEANKAKLDLATGKTASIVAIAGKIDPLHNILLMNPDDYADPMNIIMQKMNYTVYQRKNHLYNGYLYSLNKKTYSQVSEIIGQCNRKMEDLAKIRDAEMEEFVKKREAAQEQANSAGSTFQSAEWELMEHNIHVKFFNAANNVQETGFGSATNVVSTAYMKRFKPNVEAYYYDVIRHIALISDPVVRKQKDADLHNSMNQALTWFLQTILTAHGSFKYYDEWDCGCNLEELLAAREAEEKEMEAEENARVMRNKNAKAVFDSGEIPPSSQLFKRLDEYVDEYNLGLLKVRASCARTTIEVNTDWLSKPPFNVPVSFNYKSTTSEFTGATTRNGGVEVGYKAKVGSGEVKANLNLSVSVSTDGNGVVKDYSVTGGATAGVSVGGFNASVGGNVRVSGNQGGVTDFSAGANANVSSSSGSTTVSGSASASYGSGGMEYSANANFQTGYGSTTVSGGAAVSYDSRGLDSDFSAKVSQDFKTDSGTEGNLAFEASTKRGSSISGKVEQTIKPAEDAAKRIEDETGMKVNPDFYKKELWSGVYKIN